MAGKKRINVQRKTYYVLLEGHDDKLCFVDSACYKYYLTLLKSSLKAYQIDLHCYALLPNRIHLLITPSTPTGISSMMRSVGKNYVSYFNNRFNRSESMWKGKYKSNHVKDGDFILDCHKYIELAAVRSNLVGSPERYEWSSFTVNAFGGHGNGLTMHEQYRAFGAKSPNRFERYRDFLAQPYAIADFYLIQHRMLYGCPLDLKVPKARSLFSTWNPSLLLSSDDFPGKGGSTEMSKE